MRAWLFVLPLAAVALAATSAHADAIDGDWCSPQGKSFSIRGPQIDTPGGNRIQGLYDRHGFIYEVPADEPDAGAQVRMVLVNDNTVQLTVGEGATDVQTWRRCRPGVS